MNRAAKLSERQMAALEAVYENGDGCIAGNGKWHRSNEPDERKALNSLWGAGYLVSTRDEEGRWFAITPAGLSALAAAEGGK